MGLACMSPKGAVLFPLCLGCCLSGSADHLLPSVITAPSLWTEAGVLCWSACLYEVTPAIQEFLLL